VTAVRKIASHVAVAVAATVVGLSASSQAAPKAPTPTFDWLAEHLRDCPAEDSRNCSWDASERGNGAGRDFIDLNGKVYYRR
jgi:hypothetical protein